MCRIYRWRTWDTIPLRFASHKEVKLMEIKNSIIGRINVISIQKKWRV